MNEYEAKQEARRERLRTAADKARARASARFDKADLREERSGIPFGQPVLVGHHSERRHRRAIERAERNLRRGVEELKRSEELARRAGAVGTGGVSSDDPDAVAKLEAELAALEAKHAYRLSVNKAIRRHPKDPEAGAREVVARCVVDGREPPPESVIAKHWQPDCMGSLGFPSYSLSNATANMRRIRGRIEVLRAQAARREAIVSGGAQAWRVESPAGTAEECPVENRCILRFSQRLSKERWQEVRRAGFVWSRILSAFVRKPSSAARHQAASLLSSFSPPAPSTETAP